MTSQRIWTFARKPQNLALLVAVGTALGFVVKEIALPLMKHENQQTSQERQVATAEGGIAINASGESRVSVVNASTSGKTANRDAATEE